jgi:Phage integrase family
MSSTATILSLPQGKLRSIQSSAFHDLRHTCASLLIDQGAHPKMISAHLGHKSIAITMDRYGHLFEEHSERLAEMLDAIYQAAAGIACDPRAIEPIPMRRDAAEKGG